MTQPSNDNHTPVIAFAALLAMTLAGTAQVAHWLGYTTPAEAAEPVVYAIPAEDCEEVGGRLVCVVEGEPATR